jgi:hypothetical protein
MDIEKFLKENARKIFKEERKKDMDNQWTNAQINITQEELDWIEENTK